MEINDNSIRDVWRVEQEILDIFNIICKKHNLCYSLMYGTLLGAVRHHGFIPWDDDIDVIMPREDYCRLIDIWDSVAPKDYILQTKDLYADYPNNFLKIRKKHTTFLQQGEDSNKAYDKGIFIDVFPADRFAPTWLLKKTQFYACLINMLFTRNHTSGENGMVGLIEGILLRLPPNCREKWRLRTERYVQSWNGNNCLPFLVPVTVKSCHRVYPSDMFENMGELLFQGKTYSAVQNYDSVLKTVFGDYMSLPPESERTWKHRPILLDFEHSLDELENMEKTK